VACGWVSSFGCSGNFGWVGSWCGWDDSGRLVIGLSVRSAAVGLLSGVWGSERACFGGWGVVLAGAARVAGGLAFGLLVDGWGDVTDGCAGRRADAAAAGLSGRVGLEG